MSDKYSPDELKQVAQHCEEACAAGDPRYTQLIITGALRLEMHPAQVAKEISRLAHG